MMNSTYSSLVDYGLTNSQFADLSSVSEDEAEENKGTQYQNLGVVKGDNQDYEEMRAPGTAKTAGRPNERRTIVVGRTPNPQHGKAKRKHREPLASPFDLAPKPIKNDEEQREKEPDVLLLDN